MTIENIIFFVTAIVSFIFGKVAKKLNWIESQYIPYQNFLIGAISAVLYYVFIDNTNVVGAIAIAFSGLTAGGFYDMTKSKSVG